MITEIAGVLSFSALSNNDKVGMLLFTDQIETYIPPRKGKKAALRLLRDILYHQPKGTGTDINMAVEYIYRLIKKRSIIFVISDFLDSDYENSLKLLARKHDVVALRVIDKAEMELPKAGLLQFSDPETGEKLTVNTSSEKIRTRYRELALQQQTALEERFKRNQIDLVTIHTDESYTKELMKFFKLRIKRKNR